MSETPRLLFKSACKTIERALDEGKSRFILYPFGYAGVEVKRIMTERYGVLPERIVVTDNLLAGRNPEVRAVTELGKEDFDHDSAFIITAESPRTLSSLFENAPIPDFIAEDSRYYLYPNNTEEDIIYEGCHVGRGTYGYMYLLERGRFASSIGRFCSINENAVIAEDHAMDTISTYPFSNDSNSGKKEPVSIGNDVWIGENAVITMGVRIGDGAVIAAGAVVTHDVEPYAVVGGVPAREIKKRFSDGEIESLLKIRWWDWDNTTLQSNLKWLTGKSAFRI